MAGRIQTSYAVARELARRQHHVVSRAQLLELQVSRHAIEHMVARGHLHPLFRGVYAVGRPGLTWRGWWMAAVLACGAAAVLSHHSAAALWRIRPPSWRFHVTAPGARSPRGIVTHRRALGPQDVTYHHGIPVTSV